MAKLYTCTAYKNTGFNQGNVPGSTAAFAGAESVSFSALYLWQSRDLGQIRVESAWENVQDVDYVKLQNGTDIAYYIVTSISMASDNTAILDLTLDPLMTAGGVSAITVISGQANRAHVSNDALFANELSEPWAPSQPLTQDTPQIVNRNAPVDDNSTLSLTIATIDLSKIKDMNARIASAANDPAASVIWPDLPALSGGLAIRIYDPESGEGTEGNFGYLFTQGVSAYDGGNKDAQDVIAIARSLGIESAILNSYTIPKSAIEIKSGNLPYGEIRIIWAPIQHISAIANLAYKYDTPGYTPKNNKVFALYNTFQVISAVSGDNREFEARDLYKAGDQGPKFSLITDPSPNGTAYLKPDWYQGRKPKLLEQAVAGLPWVNAALIYSGSSGSALTIANARRAQASADLDRAAEVAGQELNRDALNQRSIEAAAGFLASLPGLGSVSPYGDISISAGAPGIVGRTASAAMSIGRAYQQQSLTEAHSSGSYKRAMGDNIFNTMVSTRIIAPQLAFPVSMNVAAMTGNAFMIARTRLNIEDVKRFDRFLTAYGYAVDKPFEAADLNNRAKYNYIKTTGAQVRAANVPLRILNSLSDMLDAGVRIWHVRPDPAALEDNPIKGGATA